MQFHQTIAMLSQSTLLQMCLPLGALKSTKSFQPFLEDVIEFVIFCDLYSGCVNFPTKMLNCVVPSYSLRFIFSLWFLLGNSDHSVSLCCFCHYLKEISVSYVMSAFTVVTELSKLFKLELTHIYILRTIK